MGEILPETSVFGPRCNRLRRQQEFDADELRRRRWYDQGIPGGSSRSALPRDAGGGGRMAVQRRAARYAETQTSLPGEQVVMLCNSKVSKVADICRKLGSKLAQTKNGGLFNLIACVPGFARNAPTWHKKECLGWQRTTSAAPSFPSPSLTTVDQANLSISTCSGPRIPRSLRTTSTIFQTFKATVSGFSLTKRKNH